MSERLTVHVGEDEDGERLDRILGLSNLGEDPVAAHLRRYEVGVLTAEVDDGDALRAAVEHQLAPVESLLTWDRSQATLPSRPRIVTLDVRAFSAEASFSTM